MALTEIGLKGDAAVLSKQALLRNLDIASTLGCLDSEGLAEVRRGKSATLRRGPYVGDQLSVDHMVAAMSGFEEAIRPRAAKLDIHPVPSQAVCASTAYPKQLFLQLTRGEEPGRAYPLTHFSLNISPHASRRSLWATFIHFVSAPVRLSFTMTEPAKVMFALIAPALKARKYISIAVR